jgi:hypothetical protein
MTKGRLRLFLRDFGPSAWKALQPPEDALPEAELSPTSARKSGQTRERVPVRG